MARKRAPVEEYHRADIYYRDEQGDTAAILQTYLPAQNVQRLPALLGTRESKSFESEREILYSVLFDMRQEVAELRKMVHNMMAERAGQVAQMGQVGKSSLLR